MVFLSSTLISTLLLLMRCRGVANRPLHSRVAGRPVPWGEAAITE